jgi:hypothetical protein
MPVYVDCAKIPFERPGKRTLKMSHMVATSLEELHRMADVIGMRREWFQDKNTPHYDVCWKKRGLALSEGAIEVDRREMADLCRQWRIALDTGCDKIRGVGQLGFDL